MLVLLTACSGVQESVGETANATSVSSEVETSTISREFYHSLCGPELNSKALVMCLIENNLDSEIVNILEKDTIEDLEFSDTMRSYSEMYLADVPKVEELEDLREEYMQVHGKVVKLFEKNKISAEEMSIITGKLTTILENQTARSTAADSHAKGYVEAYIGMTAEELRNSKSWGEPDHINKTTTAYGVSEQWVYYGRYVYLEDGIVTSIQE